jgi:glycosyltransferase involved in cell wall biosynthesis
MCLQIMKMKQHLIIGYDAKRIVCNNTGLGNYSRNLVNSLATDNKDIEFRLYASSEGRRELREHILPADNVKFVYPHSAHCRLQRDFWRTGGVVKDLLRDKVCLFHGLSGELPGGLNKAGIPGIVTIHDLIFFRHPEYYHWADVQIYKWKFFRTLKEAERIIAISERTKQDIVEFGHFPADRIDVIYQGCNARFLQSVTKEEKEKIKEKHHLPDHFLLCVGTIEERKNMLQVVKALLRLPVDLHLVLIGRSTPYEEKIKEFIAAQDLITRVHILHRVSDQDLCAIYQQAECFVYPSRYEGFGIPILEAIESQLPVVATTGSCLEEAGGPDNLYVSPDDVEGLAEAISKSLKGSDDRQRRILRSLEYVRRFENRSVARQVLEEYSRLLNP